MFLPHQDQFAKKWYNGSSKCGFKRPHFCSLAAGKIIMIYFNGQLPPQQPTTLNEDPRQVKTDQSSIDGSVSRNVLPKRKRASMTWDMVTPGTIQFFDNLYNTLAPIEYRNDTSSRFGILQFSGPMDMTGGTYIRGGSGLSPLTISIQEGTIYPQ